MRIISLSLALAASCLPALAEQAPPPCMLWAEAKAIMTQRSEVPVSSGRIDDKTLLVVGASPNGETFSIWGLGTDGRACLVDYGDGWEPGKNPEPEGTAG